MGSNGTEVVQRVNSASVVKAHGSICWELRKILDTIACILPEIESARPGCMYGIKELCALNNTLKKAELLIQHCTESSALYLVITAEATLLRSERIRTELLQSLCQVQDMVPQVVAAQISDAANFLRDAKFVIDSEEEEAGKAIIELLRQTNTSEELEFMAFQSAALKLNITSPKALLIERRSIQKLLDKVHNDTKKGKILEYFLYLLKKYGKKVKSDGEHKKNASLHYRNPCIESKCNARTLESIDLTDCGQAPAKLHSSILPPVEYRCPISSRLMSDPVVIASGQTYERACIEKWFSEGHDTCPKTQKKLESCAIIANTCMRDLISNWCKEYGFDFQDGNFQPNIRQSHSWEASHSGSVSSLKNVPATLLYGNTEDQILQNDHSNTSIVSSDASYFSYSLNFKDLPSLEDRRAQMFSWNDDYQKCQSFSNFGRDMFHSFFCRLSELPLEIQFKSVDDLEILLEDEEAACYDMLSNGFVEALLKFLEDTKDQSNVQAQKLGAQILLSFQSKIRVEIPEDAFQLMISLIDSDITTEALTIMRKLIRDPKFISYIDASGVPSPLIKVLDSEDNEILKLALNILYDLSSKSEIKVHISSSRCVSKLVPHLSESNLSELCIKIMRNFCDSEEAARVIVETDECLASIGEMLETGTPKEKEHAVTILYSLCSHSHEYCQLVLKEGVIPALVDMSVNGNPKGKETSTKLRCLLRDVRHSDPVDSLESQSALAVNLTDARHTNCPDSLEPQSGSASNTTDAFIDLSTESEPTSKSSGFFARKMRFFSKPKSLALS